jgi:DNA-binding XRE family transcriptional regulator
VRNELKQARLAKDNLTQKQIAKTIGITERMYRHIEAGTRNGKTEIWLKLSEVLGVDVGKIYTPNK